MDFMGLTNKKFSSFPVNRELKQEEISSEIRCCYIGEKPAKDLISVIKINNCIKIKLFIPNFFLHRKRFRKKFLCFIIIFMMVIEESHS